jgi:hypothetical protein
LFLPAWNCVRLGSFPTRKARWQISCPGPWLKIAPQVAGFRPSFAPASSYNSAVDAAQQRLLAGRFSEIGPKPQPPSADLTCCSPEITSLGLTQRSTSNFKPRKRLYIRREDLLNAWAWVTKRLVPSTARPRSSRSDSSVALGLRFDYNGPRPRPTDGPWPCFISVPQLSRFSRPPRAALGFPLPAA